MAQFRARKRAGAVPTAVFLSLVLFLFSLQGYSEILTQRPTRGINSSDQIELDSPEPIEIKVDEGGDFSEADDKAAFLLYQRLNSEIHPVSFGYDLISLEPGKEFDGNKNLFRSFAGWFKQKKLELRTLKLMARIRVLKSESEKIVRKETEWLKSYEQGEIKLPVYPVGEWDNRKYSDLKGTSSTTWTIPNVYDYHRGLKEDHQRRIVGLQLLQNILDELRLDGLNEILKNAQLPPAEEIVESIDPLRMQENIRFMVEVLLPLNRGELTEERQ